MTIALQVVSASVRARWPRGGAWMVGVAQSALLSFRCRDAERGDLAARMAQGRRSTAG